MKRLKGRPDRTLTSGRRHSSPGESVSDAPYIMATTPCLYRGETDGSELPAGDRLVLLRGSSVVAVVAPRSVVRLSMLTGQGQVPDQDVVGDGVALIPRWARQPSAPMLLFHRMSSSNARPHDPDATGMGGKPARNALSQMRKLRAPSASGQRSFSKQMRIFHASP